MTPELQNAVNLVASSMNPREASAAVSGAYNVYLKEQEDAKAHPMDSFVMSDADWQLQKAHLTDGGGVVDDAALAIEIMEALLADDQATFWPDLIHVYKSWMKIRGHMVGAPGGGMFFRGASADPTVSP